MLDVNQIAELSALHYQAGQQEARRLLHGRGHTYPGLEQVTVDVFPPYVVVGLFRDAAKVSDELVAELTSALASKLPGVEGIAVQRRDGRHTTTHVLQGEVPDRVCTQEAGLKFWVRPLANQNVGLFLDMAPLRHRLRTQSDGARVLNLFAYTCSLSVAAMAGGAAKVVNNDMSRQALDIGKENHLANEHEIRRVHMLPHNLFKSWWKVRQLGPFDTVVIDPPTNQRGSFVAEKHYGQILKRLKEFAAPGARVYACLNSPFHNADFLPGLVARWCPEAAFIERLPGSEDFPDVDSDRSLKVYEYRFGGG